MKTLSNRVQGILFMLLSAFMYATMPIIGKLAYASGLDAPLALMMRFGIAFLVLAFYLGFIKREAVIEPTPLILLQGLLLIIDALLYFVGLKYMPAGLASVAFFSYPVTMAIMAVIVFRERFSPKLFVCILMALAGISLISGLTGDTLVISPKGLMLVIIASFCYAVFGIIGQLTVSRSGPLSLTSTFSLVAIVGLCVAFPGKVPVLLHLTARQWLMGAVLALINTILALSFFLKGVQKIGASKAGLVSTAEPAITVALACLLLGESLSIIQVFGTALVLCSILVAVYRPDRESAPAQDLNLPQ